LPEQKIIDLTVSKSFRLSSKLNVQLFMNVYNLLDQRDITNVYTDTGSPEYTTTTSSARAYNSTRVSTVDDGVILPSWYTAPRQVQVGLALGFN
jgi:outer membrane receptor protein involved in Fe transport